MWSLWGECTRDCGGGLQTRTRTCLPAPGIEGGGCEGVLEEGRLEDDTEFDMYYAEVKLRNDFDLTELLQVRNKNNESTNVNFTHSTDRVFETYIYNYLGASDMDRANQYHILAQYILTTGSLIPIGFEKQELITHRGVCKGVDPNMGNPLYNFQNWEIDLEKRD